MLVMRKRRNRCIATKWLNSMDLRRPVRLRKCMGNVLKNYTTAGHIGAKSQIPMKASRTITKFAIPWTRVLAVNVDSP